ncbi:MAG: hypothetical protein NC212_04325 [Staphylococcus sp.]|nr:hypothetical protein [Staphylococcus sp.]
MAPEIRHRRLEAFYKSKVLNVLMIVVITSLFMLSYTGMSLLPGVCASLALCLFIGYSLWLWILKPKRIVVNEWLSNVNGVFTLYFLITFTFKDGSPWLCMFPVIAAIVVLFVSLLRHDDELFEI